MSLPVEPRRSPDLDAALSSRRIRAIVITGGALLCILLVAGVTWFVETGRAHALDEARGELLTLSRALAEDTDRTFQGAELLEEGVIARLQSKGVASALDLKTVAGSLDFHQFLGDKISEVLYLEALAVADNQGAVLSDSRAWPAPEVDLRDRDYFQSLARDPKQSSAVGDPSPGKVTKKWTMKLARPIVGADGRFLGLVLASIKVSYFEAAYSSFIMPGGRVSLFRDNGVLLARAPHIDEEFGLPIKDRPIFDGRDSRREGVLFVPKSGDRPVPVDVAFERLPRYPLVVTVSKSHAEIQAKWNGFAQAFYGATAGMVGLIAMAGFALIRSFEQQSENARAERARLAAEVQVSTQAALLRQAQRFEVAINNMLQGLCMFDTQDRLIVCNKRYAEMYDLPEELTQPGARWRDIVAHRFDRFGYRGLDLEAVVAEHEALDLTNRESARTRELGDGRIILVRHQPIAEGGWVATHEDITERRKVEERLHDMARHDALTGLANRVLLQERLDRAVERLADGEPFAVFCIDLDHFKETNDTLGHPVGDALLREVANRLRSTLRSHDTVARMGGDEFAVIQAGIRGSEDSLALAERLTRILNQPYEIGGHPVNTGASLGVACAPSDGDNGALLLRKADIALYRAKGEGRRGYRVFEAAMDAELQSRRNLEIEFRNALETESFEVFYQPMLDARTRTIRSFEALVRWRHPERGVIPPIEFIPLAEETGLIVPLGEWVLRAACREAARWPSDVGVSVNLSALQLKAPDLVARVRAALAESALDGRRLELEVTESILLQKSERTREILYALREMGIRFAMDDFGTGYSSLSYLQSFPFDKIKIDKSFVQNLERRDAGAIVRTIASLGKALDMSITAEGVETEAQFEAVLAMGCGEVQGYLFSKPVPSAGVGALLGAYNAGAAAA